MAETTGLLNRRTGHSVPRVRISSSPQPATAQRFSAGLFWYASDGELAHRTRHTETARTTVRSWAVARLQGPPRAAPRCRKRSAAESRPHTSSALPRIGAGVFFPRGPAPQNKHPRVPMAQVPTLFPHLRQKLQRPAPHRASTCAKGAVSVSFHRADTGRSIYFTSPALESAYPQDRRMWK